MPHIFKLIKKLANKNVKADKVTKPIIADNTTNLVDEKELFSSQSPKNVSALTDDFPALRISDVLDGQSSRNSNKLSSRSNSPNDLADDIQSCLELEVSSDDSEDDSFFDRLFTDDKPKLKFVSAQTDTFPCAYDSDNESDDEKLVIFSIDKSNWVAVAEYKGREYEIGYLDLTVEEHSYLQLISQTGVKLTFTSSDIVISRNKFNVRRIDERDVSSESKEPISLWSEILNLGRIQFSTTEPLLAKYQNQVYFVGNNLQDEYLSILRQSSQIPGTAIRICKDRVTIDQDDQILDINRSVSFENQAKICVITAPKSVSLTAFSSNEFRRYVINKKSCDIVAVEPALLHSSVHDKVTEIYAENNFPFSKPITKSAHVTDNTKEKISAKEKIAPNNETATKEKIASKEKTAPKEIAPKKKIVPKKEIATKEKIAPKKEIATKEKVVPKPKYDSDEEDSEESQYEFELRMNFLKSYAVPDDVKTLVSENKLSKLELAATRFGAVVSKKKGLRTQMEDYIEGYKMMIHIEEEEQARYLDTFNKTDIELTYHMDRQFRFPVTDSELAGAVEEGHIDRFILKPKKMKMNVNKRKKEKVIWGQIVRLRGKEIIIEIFPDTYKLVMRSHRYESYDIFFTLNRVPFQLQHYALDFIRDENLFTRLINNTYYDCKSTNLALPNGLSSTQKHKFKYEGMALDKLNPEQKSAVENMISKVDSLPYVLFGPPGTGKTRTLVAAIEQIVRTTDKNILVCAMSNAACDEITERLLGILDAREMYRFYARSYKNERINAQFVGISNFSRQGIFYPPLKYLYKFRVLICTLCSAGCLTRARVDKKWRPDHFNYVFIDECASAQETMSLIPIAGLCTSENKIHAKIIVAGDPKQLDAVTRSYKAKQLGYNISWMERLCSSPLYMRNSNTGEFNPTYITQLVKNYRSHPKILSIPNELFYENKLQANAAQNDISWYINSKFLPSKQFPMVFISVQGKSERSIEQSWYNNKEIEEIINVIKRLLPPKAAKEGLRSITQSDIGVVTPYRKQRFKLSQRLRYLNFDEVTVGTAEVFQGKERPVMIISTVRSDGELGFVADPRRLNVVITRAKCLVVIIGDPHTLGKNENWRRVIEYCMENNSLIQSDKVYPEKVARKITKKLGKK